MLVNQIQERELTAYKDKVCPKCSQGMMWEVLDHDAMAGNRSVLRCNKRNPCSHTIVIIPSN
ncbi:MAG: hypothetical protein Q8P20_03410 [bacterium]|nr:hypothetical protein [bacterium]